MSEGEAVPTPAGDGLAAAAKRSSIGAVAPGDAPSGSALLTAMGGVRGLVESILPGLSFLVVYTFTAQLVPSVVIPLALAVVFVVIRMVTRAPIAPAIAGVAGVALSAGLALVTGRAEDNFIPGFILNGAFLAVLLVSIAIRRPLIGVIASLLSADGGAYRRERAKFRVALIATILWCGLFSLRLGVELPLFFSGNVQALATTKLILGVPFYAAMLWITWLLARTVYARPKPE